MRVWPCHVIMGIEVYLRTVVNVSQANVTSLPSSPYSWMPVKYLPNPRQLPGNFQDLIAAVEVGRSQYVPVMDQSRLSTAKWGNFSCLHLCWSLLVPFRLQKRPYGKYLCYVDHCLLFPNSKQWKYLLAWKQLFHLMKPADCGWLAADWRKSGRVGWRTKSKRPDVKVSNNICVLNMMCNYSIIIAWHKAPFSISNYLHCYFQRTVNVDHLPYWEFLLT